LLAEVTVEGSTLDSTLGSLVAAGVLTVEDDPIEPAYRFRHPLARDVAYGSILFARRHRLHEQVAAAVTRVHVTDLDEHRVVLAQHYLLAGMSEAAFPHLVLAAQRAQARYANSEAIALYRQAIAIAPERGDANEPLPPRLADLYERLGDVLTLTGEYAAARSNYDLLLRAGVAEEALSRATRRASLQRRVGGTYERQGNLDHALEWLKRAGETIVGSGLADRGLEHAHILSDIGWARFRGGALDTAQELLERVLALLERHQDHRAQAQLLNRLGGIAWSRGDLGQARHFVERSLVLSAANDLLPEQANALNNLSVLAEQQGAIEDTLHFARQAMAIHERIGSRRDLSMVDNNIGYALYNQGRYDEARASLTQALDRSTEVRDTYHQMLALLNLSRVAVAEEQWQDATAAAEQAQFIAAQLGIQAVQSDCCVVLVEAALGQGDLGLARHAHRQLALLETEPNSEERGRALRADALLAHAEGDVAHALGRLDAAEECFSAAQYTTELRRTQRLRAAWTPDDGAERSTGR
jgi:tetratricopeptide (TPR) repeat protein